MKEQAQFHAATAVAPGGKGNPPWVVFSAPIVSMATLIILGFLYPVVVASIFQHSKTLEVALFIFGTLLLGPLCALAQVYFIRPNFESRTAGAVEVINFCAAVFALLCLSAVSVTIWALNGGADRWANWSRAVIYIALAIHILALALRKRLPPASKLLSFRSAQAATFLVVFSLAAVALFTVNLSHPYFNGFFELFLAPRFVGGKWEYAAILAIAGIIVFGSLAIARFEAGLPPQRRATLRALQFVVLCLTILALFVAYFDYSLLLEPIHYLTNAGPAQQVLHGRIPMVDAFSQYGLGPLMVTVMAYWMGPHTLGTAALAAQLTNLLFYALWLACLFRMTPWKMSALLLGFCAVGCLLASWGYGDANINIAPSILGLRYLPTLGMVLAISHLRAPARWSASTVICTAISAVWSVECLINTLCVHIGFIVFFNLRRRAFRQMVVDLSWAVGPAAIAIFIASAVIRIYAGTWPQFGTYLAFLTVYNPVSGYWSEIANTMFLAWITGLLAICLVLADASMRILDGSRFVTALDDVALYYRFLPMAMLAIALSAYFAFRSADYVLVIAFLPFCALAIPAVLHFAYALANADIRYKVLLLPPALISIAALAFSGLALSQIGGPYTLFLQECRDLGRCSATALANVLHDNLRRRHVLEVMGVRFSDQYRAKYPLTLIGDAVAAIGKYAPNQDRVTVLLGGDTQHDSIASDLTLMYAGKGNRWPISYVFTDELLPSLAKRIIAAPVRLRPGEIVVVRTDESTLGDIEAGILRKIRRNTTLCQMPKLSRVVDIYRVAGTEDCP